MRQGSLGALTGHGAGSPPQSLEIHSRHQIRLSHDIWLDEEGVIEASKVRTALMGATTVSLGAILCPKQTAQLVFFHGCTRPANLLETSHRKRIRKMSGVKESQDMRGPGVADDGDETVQLKLVQLCDCSAALSGADGEISILPIPL